MGQTTHKSSFHPNIFFWGGRKLHGTHHAGCPSDTHLPVRCSSGPPCPPCSSDSPRSVTPLGTGGTFRFSCVVKITVSKHQHHHDSNSPTPEVTRGVGVPGVKALWGTFVIRDAGPQEDKLCGWRILKVDRINKWRKNKRMFGRGLRAEPRGAASKHTVRRGRD